MQHIPGPAIWWQWAVRLLWHVVVATAVSLLAATVSPRFLQVTEPWLFFVLGAAVGIPVALVPLAVSQVSELRQYRQLVTPLGMLVAAIVIAAIVGLVMPEIDISIAGVVLIAMGVTAIGLLIHQIVDIPEFAPDAE